jgi:hypothetical protein
LSASGGLRDAAALAGKPPVPPHRSDDSKRGPLGLRLNLYFATWILVKLG